MEDFRASCAQHRMQLMIICVSESDVVKVKIQVLAESLAQQSAELLLVAQNVCKFVFYG